MDRGARPVERVPHRRSWPYLSASPAVYLIVMVPICALEAFLLATNSPGWMRWSAGAVVAISAYGLLRGFARRLVLDDRGARLVGVLRTIRIDWPRVRRVGVYVPGGGVGATEYAYITTRDGPPAGKWDIDAETIQLQNRPGLMEAIAAARAEAGGGDSTTDSRS